MPSLVPQLANTATFGALFNTVNLLANVTSNVVLYVGSNTTGDAGVTGNLYSNSLVSNFLYVSNAASLNSVSANTLSLNNTRSLITVGNSTVNAAINSTSFAMYTPSVNFIVNAPTANQVNNGQYFLNANGSYATVAFATYPITNSNIRTIGTNTTILDSWSMSTYNAAQYLISVVDNNANNFYSSTLLVSHNSNTAESTEFGQIISNTSVGSFTATTNSSSVILSFTPVSANTNVKFVRMIS